MSNVLFRDFIALYMNDKWHSDRVEINRPLVITISDDARNIKYLFATEWSALTRSDLKMFVSPEVYDAYVDKFYLTKSGNIGVTLTGEWNEEEK